MVASIGSHVFLDISSDITHIRLTGTTVIFLDTRMSVTTASGLHWPVFFTEKESFDMEGVPKNHFAARFLFSAQKKYYFPCFHEYSAKSARFQLDSSPNSQCNQLKAQFLMI